MGARLSRDFDSLSRSQIALILGSRSAVSVKLSNSISIIKMSVEVNEHLCYNLAIALINHKFYDDSSLVQGFPNEPEIAQVAETIGEVLDNLAFRNADSAYIAELRLQSDVSDGLTKAWEEHRNFVFHKIGFGHHFEPQVSGKITWSIDLKTRGKGTEGKDIPQGTINFPLDTNSFSVCLEKDELEAFASQLDLIAESVSKYS